MSVPSWRADERVEVRASYCFDRKLSLTADETQVGKRHEYVEMGKLPYYFLP